MRWNLESVLATIAFMEKKGILICTKNILIETSIMDVSGQSVVAVRRDFTRARFRLSRTPNQPA
jgi:hypothetical protein